MIQLSNDPKIQAEVVVLIEKDVTRLLNRQLKPEAIRDDRYEELLGVDLFDGF